MRWNGYTIHFQYGQPQYAEFVLERISSVVPKQSQIVNYLRKCGFIINNVKAQFYSNEWECGYHFYFNKDETVV